MRAKDSVTLNTLRALKTALTNTAIAKGGLGTQLEEAEELAVVRKQIKQREDSTEQFRSAGRPELADKEEAEIAVPAMNLRLVARGIKVSGEFPARAIREVM